jgi:translocator protein
MAQHETRLDPTGAATSEGASAGRWRDLPVLAASVAAVVVVAAIGGSATTTGPGSWYAGLTQPSWNPPDWLFGPVWTALYAAMAVAAWLVWRDGHRGALVPYGVQLALNLAWTLTFFGAESTWGGVVVIGALWVAIAVTIAVFRPVPVAAWLLVPYLGWVTYAGALTLSIALAN